jgi:protein-tyrosine phosphatase
MSRNWHNTLFLGPMPGTEAPLQEWLDELDEAGITAIVCLNPEDEISLLSPEYRDWRQYRAPHSELRRFDVPVDDGYAPTGAVVNQFWNAASEVAERCRRGEHTFIHCTAGRGRTGMFGVAVLVALGYSIVDAATQLYQVGSYPETDQQDALLATSLP